MSDDQREIHVGYVMDIACVRKAPPDALVDLASAHTTECALMGHCIESGFALIDSDARLHLLEPAATADVVRELRRSRVEEGLQLEVVRERDSHEMRTIDLRAVAPEGRG